MSDFDGGFWVGVLITAIMMGASMEIFTVFERDVRQGEEIILHNKSYKCELVNEL